MIKKIDFSKLKSLLWIIILIIPIILFFATAEKTKKAPEWYENKPENTEFYLYGIGKGYNIEAAEEVALKDLIASSIYKKDVKKLPFWKKSGYESSTEFYDKINTALRTLTITEHQIIETKYLNEEVYLIISIKKNELIEANINKITELNQKIAELNSETVDEHIFLRRKALQEINKLSNRAENLTKIMEKLFPYKYSKKYLKTYKDFREKYDKINKKIRFYVKGKDVRKEVIKAFNDGVYDADLTLANQLNEGDRYLTIINLNTKTTTNTLFKTIHAKIEINISIEDGRKNKLAKTKLEINGNSTINKEEAIKNAAENLSKIIKQEGLMKLIGGMS